MLKFKGDRMHRRSAGGATSRTDVHYAQTTQRMLASVLHNWVQNN